MKILILASNPRNDLDLNQEIRDLKDVIDSSRNRQEFEVEDALAVRVGDLQELLFKHQPQIVHFCGHGGGQPGLVFEGNNGGERWVRTEALRDLFRLFSSKVGCVLLNACYSEEQANEIVNHIDYVIGMNQAIRDDAAIAFAKGFYRALGYNCSIEEAYEFGCNAIQLEITGDSTTRSGTTESVRKAELVNATASTIMPDIPEHLKPVLKKRPQAGSSSRWREGATTPPPLSPETKEALQQEVVRAVTGFGSNNRSASTPNLPIVISEPPQALPEPPKTIANPRHRFGPLILGSLVACLIPAIGFYGYQQWQKRQSTNVTLPSTDVSQNINISKPNGTMSLNQEGANDNKPDKSVDEKNEERLRLASRFVLDKNWEAVISTLNQIPADSAVATRNEFQAYLDNASEQMLRSASELYEKDNIDSAINKAKLVPRNSQFYYKQAQTVITTWSAEKEILVEIKSVLKSSGI
jgi:hypothetical protein